LRMSGSTKTNQRYRLLKHAFYFIKKQASK